MDASSPCFDELSTLLSMTLRPEDEVQNGLIRMNAHPFSLATLFNSPMSSSIAIGFCPLSPSDRGRAGIVHCSTGPYGTDKCFPLFASTTIA